LHKYPHPRPQTHISTFALANFETYFWCEEKATSWGFGQSWTKQVGKKVGWRPPHYPAELETKEAEGWVDHMENNVRFEKYEQFALSQTSRPT